jgi:hypothetical protein
MSVDAQALSNRWVQIFQNDIQGDPPKYLYMALKQQAHQHRSLLIPSRFRFKRSAAITNGKIDVPKNGD